MIPKSKPMHVIGPNVAKPDQPITQPNPHQLVV
jgi:hypothetical protein